MLKHPPVQFTSHLPIAIRHPINQWAIWLPANCWYLFPKSSYLQEVQTYLVGYWLYFTTNKGFFLGGGSVIKNSFPVDFLKVRFFESPNLENLLHPRFAEMQHFVEGRDRYAIDMWFLLSFRSFSPPKTDSLDSRKRRLIPFLLFSNSQFGLQKRRLFLITFLQWELQVHCFCLCSAWVRGEVSSLCTPFCDFM